MNSGHRDHRVRVTKMLIRKAFTELLWKKPIQSITVKELCEKAGVNRGTFYAHYTDVYDLRSQMEAELMEDFRRALDPLLDMHGNAPSPAEVTADIFKCLKDNMDICTVVLGEYGDREFAMRLIALGWERCQEHYSRLRIKASPRQMELFYAFVSSGFVGLMRKWLETGMDNGAGEAAELSQRLMDQCVKAIADI